MRNGDVCPRLLGIDYHDILRDRLEKLIQFIKAQAENLEEAESWRFAPQVDTGELVDVAVAQRAGLGFIGRNGLLITEEFGSFCLFRRDRHQYFLRNR